jgi:hypothetical protein
MKITELLLAELDREAVGSRKALERVPEGKNDWKPHEKSMPLGRLATIVATIPAWLDMVVNLNELDINPPGGQKFMPQPWKTRRDLLDQFDASLKKDREVLQKTTDDHLFNTKWRMLAAGKLMSELAALHRDPRRRAQPYGSSSRPVDRLSPSERRESPGDLRTFSR